MILIYAILQVAVVVMASFCLGVTTMIVGKLTAFRAPGHVAPVASGFAIVALVAAVKVYTGDPEHEPGWLFPLAAGFALCTIGLVYLLRGKIQP